MNRSIATFFFQSSRRFLGQLTSAFCLTVLLTLPIPKIAYPASGSDSSQQESILIPEIVVTATRIPEETSRIPANVTVIKGEDIRNSSADNVPELLRMQQGVQVTDVTGNHRTYSVDLRGFGDAAPQNTLVLVDGRRITQADLSGTDWRLIPLDRIERIEITASTAPAAPSV